jgi:hypothetical protein
MRYHNTASDDSNNSTIPTPLLLPDKHNEDNTSDGNVSILTVMMAVQCRK